MTLLPERTYQNLHHGTADHTLSMVKPSSPHSKTVSSLEVKKKLKPLPCDGKATIYIQYAIAGETEGFVDVMWLVSTGFKEHLHFEMNHNIKATTYH